MTESILDRDEEAPEVQTVSWSLEGSDCETCGWSPDKGEFFLWPDGACYLQTRAGCYGGTFAEGREEILKEIKYLASYEEYTPYVNQIRELLGEDS